MIYIYGPSIMSTTQCTNFTHDHCDILLRHCFTHV